MSAYDDRDNRPPRQINQGSGCGKIFLILLAIAGAGTLMLCCGGGLFMYWGFKQFNFTMEPAKVREVAESMLDITIPDGYTPAMAMDMKQLNFGMAAFMDEKESRGIILMKFPPGGSFSDQKANLKQARGDNDFEIEKSEEKTFKLNGEEVTFLVQEGKSKQGQAMRQFVGDIPGKNGKIGLMMFGTSEKVTEEDFQKLLDTIKTADSKSNPGNEADSHPGSGVVAPPVQPADPVTPTQENNTEENNTGEKPAAETETDTPADSESAEKAAAEK